MYSVIKCYKTGRENESSYKYPRQLRKNLNFTNKTASPIYRLESQSVCVTFTYSTMALPSKAYFLSAIFLLLAFLPATVLSRQSVKEPKAFSFLQHLEGWQKGKSVNGINDLRQYLRKFGYLSSANIDSNGDSDELLESAIKTYQLNYNLNVTGILDSRTVKQMMAPRCGVPDIHDNGQTSMRSGKDNTKRHNDGQHTHTVLHFSFFPGAPRWPSSKKQLTYTYSSSASTAIYMQDLRDVSSRAFSRWAAVSDFTFSEVNTGEATDILIGFHRLDHGDGRSFDGPGGAIAHSSAPTSGRLHYDADENWSTNPGPDMVDLESVAVHEIGHLLGLGHSSDFEAVMYPSVSYGEVKRELAADDIVGIRTLYSLSK